MKNHRKLLTGFDTHRRGANLRLVVTGPLLGLAYIVLLPFIGLGTCAIAAYKRIALAMGHRKAAYDPFRIK